MSLVWVGEGDCASHHTSQVSCQCWSPQCPHRSRCLQLLLSPPALAVPTVSLVSPQPPVSPTALGVPAASGIPTAPGVPCSLRCPLQPPVSLQHPVVQAGCWQPRAAMFPHTENTSISSHQPRPIGSVRCWPSVPGNAARGLATLHTGSPHQPPGLLTPPVTSCHLPWRRQGVSQAFLEKWVRGAGRNERGSARRELNSPAVTQGGVGTAVGP